MRSRNKTEFILQTKILLPHIKRNTLKRPRLLKMLKTNIDKRLIMISAGAGYGKTTLISQFLSETGIPSGFYLLEKTDGELTVFFSYLVAALAKICHGFGQRTKNVLATVKNPKHYVEQVAGTFINEVSDTITNDFIIILDDYHSIMRSRYVTQAIDYMLTHAPPFLHMIIASREKINLHLAKLKAKNECLEISYRDLRFTQNEIRTLFRDIHSVKMSEKELHTITEHSEGWVTALLLMLQTSRQTSDDLTKISHTLSTIGDYEEWQEECFNLFAQEIYDREPSKLKQFMVGSSLLESIDQPTCTAILGRRDGYRMLQILERRNSFLFRLPDNSYRFHHLFREFLQSKLTDTQQKKGLLLKAARYFERKRQPEYAVGYFLQAEHFARAAKVLTKIGYDLADKGKSNTVCAYIEQFPAAMIEGNPDLLMVHGYALMLNGFHNDAAKNLRHAIRLYRRQKRSSLNLARAYYELASLDFIRGNDKRAMACLRKALAASPSQRNITYTRILNSLGILYSRMGVRRFSDATTHFERALRLAKRLRGYEDVVACIYNNWAMTEQKMGNLHAAYEKSLKAVDILSHEQHFVAQSGATFSSAAWLSIQVGRKEHAKDILQRGISISRKYNDVYSLALLARGYALYYYETGDYEKARIHAEEAVRFFEQMKFFRLMQMAYRDLSMIGIRQGLLVEAEDNLNSAWKIKETRDDAAALPLLLTEARLRRAQREYDEAEGVLEYALKLARKYGQVYEAFRILLETAYVLHDKGRDDAMARVLTQALNICKEKGYEYPLAQKMKNRMWMIELLYKTDERYTVSLLRTYNIPYHRVEISLLGTAEVAVDGIKMDRGLWKTTKAMKLFCYLCLSKKKRCSRDTLLDAVWKDVPVSRSMKSLRTAMHNIRIAFKRVTGMDDNPIVYKNGHYALSADFAFHLDTDRFTTLIEQAKQDRRGYRTFTQQMEQIIRLYAHGFAPDWFDDWVEELRSRYATAYEEILELAANHAMQKRKFRDAYTWAHRLVDSNPYEEGYHRILWRICAKLKKFRAIERDFERLELLYDKELKTALEQDTIDLYHTLIG